jgi:hypothetical protein
METSWPNRKDVLGFGQGVTVSGSSIKVGGTTIGTIVGGGSDLIITDCVWQPLCKNATVGGTNVFVYIAYAYCPEIHNRTGNQRQWRGGWGLP